MRGGAAPAAWAAACLLAVGTAFAQPAAETARPSSTPGAAGAGAGAAGGGAGAGASTASTGTSAAAGGSHPRARLLYDRAPEASRCPDEKELQRAVAERLGYDPFVPDAATLVRATIGGRGGALVARIQIIIEGTGGGPASAGGTREIRSPARDCRDLAGAAALAISIAIDPEQGLSLPASPPAAPATPSGAAPPGPPPRPPAAGSAGGDQPPEGAAARSDAGTAEAGVEWQPYLGAVGVFTAAAGATLPLGGAAGLSAGARHGWMSAGIEVRLALPQTVAFPEGMAGRVHASTSQFLAGLCGHDGVFGVCAVAALALTTGSAEMLARMRDVTLVAWGAGGRAEVQWPPHGRITANLFAEVLVFGRSVLTVDGAAALAAGRVVGGLGLAARLQFR